MRSRPKRGPKPRGLDEATVYVRVSRELHEASADAAREDGVALAEWWREAAERWLRERGARET